MRHHHYLIPEHFHPPALCPSVVSPHSPPPHRPCKPRSYSLSLRVCLLWIYRVNGMIHHVVFYVSLLSLSMTFFRFAHVITCITMHSFMWLNSIPFLCVDGPHCLSVDVHQFIDICVAPVLASSWTLLLWTDIRVQVFVRTCVISLGHIGWSGIAGLCVNF